MTTTIRTSIRWLPFCGLLLGGLLSLLPGFLLLKAYKIQAISWELLILILPLLFLYFGLYCIYSFLWMPLLKCSSKGVFIKRLALPKTTFIPYHQISSYAELEKSSYIRKINTTLHWKELYIFKDNKEIVMISTMYYENYKLLKKQITKSKPRNKVWETQSKRIFNKRYGTASISIGVIFLVFFQDLFLNDSPFTIGSIIILLSLLTLIFSGCVMILRPSIKY